MANLYATTITTRSAFEKRKKAEQAKELRELNIKAANCWGRAELFGCLRGYEMPADSQLLPEMKAFIKGPSETDWDMTIYELYHLYGQLGEVWSALAQFREDRQLPEQTRTTRYRKVTTFSQYASSTSMQVGSSPAEGDQEVSPEIKSSPGGEYVETRGVSSTFSEDETAHLAFCVVKYILYYGYPQKSFDIPVAVFRNKRIKLQWEVQLSREQATLSATDDGGIRFIRPAAHGQMAKTWDHFIILEAKRELTNFPGDPVDKITDEALAQMTCEALVARHHLHVGEDQSVFIIHAARCFFCFLEFTISTEYLRNFGEAGQKECIDVYRTRWYNLTQEEDRKAVMLHIGAIVQKTKGVIKEEYY
ncbi:hypothetical protein CDD81_1476 [Ophiocordyceps australis]|uniref:Uncharacterized protein n=1 Tax=Ophiocordyceps australis TaxID=1399860 RepID=A0A2C5XB81_9HYPO|nr:hypothetical protein CDD81_1476 [Ophiocordyceps australis]